ncbi:hypothetical protein HMPREF0322_03889 [Desulfitobacterium hafniense DP7]|uniref:Integrase catalytic domain-containing protein n=1 Tax=Desulfitobacterium hafniense DP7 TaxID=537010 RepID=G9XSE0_DESHA|nr:hypothetical protein HMPREF0322_03889 [Desulfitobacterium hafniense DP7]
MHLHKPTVESALKKVKLFIRGQGSQLTSGKFQTLLQTYGAVSSVSRKGNPYDNALLESFHRTIKRELILDAHFKTSEQAQKEIFKYIELYYNTKRMHSSLGYLSPTQFEELGHEFPLCLYNFPNALCN